MPNPDLSIIIPVHNGEKYITRCISSLLKIIDPTTELILINDGSTDNSADILKTLAKTSKNLIIINSSKNHGVSHARNLGLKKATGKYITFADIDDQIHPEMYQKLYSLAQKNNLDIATCNFYEYYEGNRERINSKYSYRKEIISQPDITNRYLLDQISNALWDKLYRNNLIKSLKFNESLAIGEDILFNLEALPRAKSLGFIPERLYGYTQQPLSAMHSISPKLTQYQSVPNKLPKANISFLQSNFPEELAFFRCQMLTRTIHAISMSATKNTYRSAKSLLKKVATPQNLSLILQNPNIPKATKLEIRILKTFGPSLHLRLMPLYKYLRSKTR